jgi:Holliday junction resolvase
MAGNETLLFRRLRDSLPDAIFTRIESRVNLGIPDCLIALDGQLVAVELKVVTRGNKVAISAHQISWLERHAKEGVPCYVLVAVKKNVSTAVLRLYGGDQAAALSVHGLALEPVDEWPWRSVPWIVVRERLSR